MIQLYSDNKHLIDRFNIKSMEREVEIVVQVEQIQPSGIVITSPSTVKELLGIHPTLKLMVLSDAPSFEEGSALLPMGIRGYGNTYIHFKHLMQAIITIENGSIWLYPSFMQQLIHGIAKKNRDHSALLDRLTERERETALLVKEGKSNKEIASKLNITERTVKQHMSNIFEKLGVSDRLSLAMKLK